MQKFRNKNASVFYVIEIFCIYFENFNPIEKKEYLANVNEN